MRYIITYLISVIAFIAIGYLGYLLVVNAESVITNELSFINVLRLGEICLGMVLIGLMIVAPVSSILIALELNDQI
jgi:hypothetical protein